MELSPTDEHFAAGDHLRVLRVGHSHHGIYLGSSCVAEFGGDKSKKSGAAFREVNLALFEADGS